MTGLTSAIMAIGAGLGLAVAAAYLDQRLDLLLDRGWRAAAGCRDRLVAPWSSAGGRVFTGLAMLAVAPLTLPGGPAPLRAGLAYFLASLLVLAWIDARHRILPDLLQLPLLLAGYGLAAWQQVPGSDAVMGSLLGCLLGLVLHRGGRGGFGWGDVKLLAALGPWLGPIGLLLAFVIGACALLAVQWRRQPAGSAARPFGPFLAGGSLAVLLLLLFTSGESGGGACGGRSRGYGLGAIGSGDIYNLFHIDGSQTAFEWFCYYSFAHPLVDCSRAK